MKTVRLTITLGEDDARKLAVWAWLKGRSPAIYAANIVSARIDSCANRKLQDDLLLDAAEARGLSKKEMIDFILADIEKTEKTKKKKDTEEYE